MNDRQIVEMYWSRDEKAVNETAKKYGSYCYTIAFGILHNQEDSKESVNDTYMSAWNSMPPNKPKILKTFLGKITRRISIDRWRRKTAQKRGEGERPEVLGELSECIAENGNPVNEIEKKLLNETVNDFIKGLKDTEQKVFMCRYWYADSVESIAKQFGFTQSKVKSMLMRSRLKLKKRLTEEDLI